MFWKPTKNRRLRVRSLGLQSIRVSWIEIWSEAIGVSRNIYTWVSWVWLRGEEEGCVVAEGQWGAVVLLSFQKKKPRLISFIFLPLQPFPFSLQEFQFPVHAHLLIPLILGGSEGSERWQVRGASGRRLNTLPTTVNTWVHPKYIFGTWPELHLQSSGACVWCCCM